ncbi:hypothetical protein BD560DRAFT_447735 [Blakeslea trispora]|nr:hypothetical protein BD560DRAFT_447735 [Blakeslea trispora]
MSDSEEEYRPLAATWGDQAPTTAQQDWNSLLDPTIKAGPNNLGNGNLHRKGKNYKPIDEEYILAHRKNIQVPKKEMKEAIRKTEEALGLPESKRTTNTKKKPGNSRKNSTVPHASQPSQKTALSPKRSKPLELMTIRSPPLNDEVGLKWSQAALVDTPFWEQKDKSTLTNKHDNDMAHPSWTSRESHTTSPPVSSSQTTATHDTASPPSVTEPSPPLKQTSEKPSTNGWDFLDSITKAKQGSHKETVRPAATKDDRTEEQNKGGWGEIETPSKDDWNNTSSENLWSTSTADAQDSGWNTPSESNANWSTDSSWNTSLDAHSGKAAKNGWDTTSATDTQSDSNSIPSDRPSWLNTIPNQSSHNQRQSSNSDRLSRFSNPSKQRYSDYSTSDLPKPANYQSDRRVVVPTQTAPPPPPKNTLLVTVNVELSDSVKVPVPIRELDEPSKLALEFGEKYNIQAASVIAALTKLFTSQKELAAKKKQQKLQRRVVNQNTYSPSPAYSSQPAHTPPTSFSSYTSNRFANTTPSPKTSSIESTLDNSVHNSYQSSASYSSYANNAYSQYRSQPARSTFQYY